MGRTRDAYIYRRAFDLAQAGTHSDFTSIISALLEEGYTEAAETLNTDLIQTDLNTICKRHSRGRDPSRRHIIK